MKPYHSKTRYLIFVSLLFPLVTVTIIGAYNIAFSSPKTELLTKVQATVEKIESNTVFFKTETGTRNVSVKRLKKEQIESLKPGDRVVLAINKDNLIEDIERSNQ